MSNSSLTYSPSAKGLTGTNMNYSPENPIIIEKKFRTPTLERSNHIPSQLAPIFGPLGFNCRGVSQRVLEFARSIKWTAKYIRIRFIVKSRNSLDIQLIEHSPLLIISNLGESNNPQTAHQIVHNGNLTFDQVIEIAKNKKKCKTARTLKAKVKEVLGTCKSVGCTVNGEDSRIILLQIENGSNVYQILEE